MLFMLFNYGIGSDFTSGFGVIERSGNVEASYSSIVHIVVWEQNNIWIGPRFVSGFFQFFMISYKPFYKINLIKLLLKHIESN